MIIKPNSILLFQGDSVTDCYRDRLDDSKLGNSHVPMIYEYLKQYNIKVINRAIAGNRVDHLLNRFEKDFKQVNPDYLVLLIGVNDTWHDFPNQKTNEVFEKEFDLLLSKIKNEMNCDVLILEPFILGFKKEYIIMRDDLHQKIEIIKKISKKYNTEYLSFEHELILEACARAPFEFSGNSSSFEKLTKLRHYGLISNFEIENIGSK